MNSVIRKDTSSFINLIVDKAIKRYGKKSGSVRNAEGGCSFLALKASKFRAKGERCGKPCKSGSEFCYVHSKMEGEASSSRKNESGRTGTIKGRAGRSEVGRRPAATTSGRRIETSSRRRRFEDIEEDNSQSDQESDQFDRESGEEDSDNSDRRFFESDTEDRDATTTSSSSSSENDNDDGFLDQSQTESEKEEGLLESEVIEDTEEED